MISSGTAPVCAVIATRNGASRGYIFSAIDSVLAQTVRPAEIVVVDDASTDETAATLEGRYQDSVRVLRLTKNRGPSGARNEGVRATQSPVIAFLDDDDEWLPNKLEVQLQAMRDRTALFVSNRVQLIDATGSPLSQSWPACPEAFSWPGILFFNPVHGPSSVMVSREALAKVGGFPDAIRIGEDWVLWARIARLRPLESLDQPLTRYRLHQQQAAAGFDMTWVRERTLEALAELTHDLPAPQRDLVLRAYAYGGVWRALAARKLRAARQLATASGACVHWRLLLRTGATGVLAKMVPALAERIDRGRMAKLIREFEARDCGTAKP